MSRASAEAALDAAIKHWAPAWSNCDTSISDTIESAWRAAKLPHSAKDGKTILCDTSEFVVYAHKNGSRVDYYMRIRGSLPKPHKNPLRSLKDVQKFCAFLCHGAC